QGSSTSGCYPFLSGFSRILPGRPPRQLHLHLHGRALGLRLRHSQGGARGRDLGEPGHLPGQEAGQEGGACQDVAGQSLGGAHAGAVSDSEHPEEFRGPFGPFFLADLKVNLDVTALAFMKLHREKYSLVH
ncbi:unnamed protein product, partial [Effrenium voratum]